MERISWIVVLAVVACGASAIWFRLGQTSKRVGENLTITSRDGTIIGFTRQGSGPPLIIVDGSFCYRDNGPAAELASMLAQQFTVFTYDRRGRGQSGDTPPYSVQREIEDVQGIAMQAGAPPFAVGISSGGALILQAVASGVRLQKIVLYEPPYLSGNSGPRSFEDARHRLQSLVSAGDRAGAVRFFMTNVYGAPGAFGSAMPFLMPSAWMRNKLVVHTVPYDLTILDDRSVLLERSSSISTPALVVGGEQSPKGLHDAVEAVAGALPNAQARFLPGQDHNFSAQALAPLVREFFVSGI